MYVCFINHLWCFVWFMFVFVLRYCMCVYPMLVSLFYCLNLPNTENASVGQYKTVSPKDRIFQPYWHAEQILLVAV